MALRATRALVQAHWHPTEPQQAPGGSQNAPPPPSYDDREDEFKRGRRGASSATATISVSVLGGIICVRKAGLVSKKHRAQLY